MTEPVVPYKRYTLAELNRLRSNPEYEAWQAKGYHWRYNLDGTAQLVHWKDVPGTAGRPFRDDIGTQVLTPAPPIAKRKPIDRVDSLMLKLIEDMRKYGTIPGVTDAKMSEIVGEAWKTGRTEITAEVVREVAKHFLGEAESRYEESESRKVVRTAPSD